jgi:hypothetical protein
VQGVREWESALELASFMRERAPPSSSRLRGDGRTVEVRVAVDADDMPALGKLIDRQALSNHPGRSKAAVRGAEDKDRPRARGEVE